MDLPDLYTDPTTGAVFDTSTGDQVGQAPSPSTYLNTPTVVGNTGGAGTNDTSSPWGSVLSGVSSLGNTSASILKAINGQPTTTKKTSALPSWLPIAAIAGAALLVLLLVIPKR